MLAVILSTAALGLSAIAAARAYRNRAELQSIRSDLDQPAIFAAHTQAAFIASHPDTIEVTILD